MASVDEIRQLRSKVARVLKSEHCFKIRFKLDNVGIQTFMYSYIADAIMADRVHIGIGGGNGYDHESNTLSFFSTRIQPASMVHEATHAVIDATHPGKMIRKGSHEASAYLAEVIYQINADDETDLMVPHLMRPVYQLARKVIAFNTSNRSGLFVCPPPDVLEIQAILKMVAKIDVDRVDLQDGIGDGLAQWAGNARRTIVGIR